MVLIFLTLISYPGREGIYRAISGFAHDVSFVGTISHFITDPGLVLLVGTTAVLVVWSFLKDRRIFWRLVAGGIGVVGSYGVNKVLKSLFEEERPCRTFDVATVVTCPEVGSWSFPSNHSVIAAAFATACILVMPKLAWYTIPAALLIAVSRVAVGAHYLHDVLAGVTVGTLLVVVVVFVFDPIIQNVFNKKQKPDEQL